MPKSSSKYFHFEHQNPDAIVIANRGSEFERDITESVISFNTSNSIDSSAGNFTLVVDNTNDKYMSRFGYCAIPKMSSIEMFAKNQKALSDGKDPQSFNVSQIVELGEEFVGTNKDKQIKGFDKFFETYYDGQADQRLTIIDKLNSFNRDLKKPIKVFRIEKTNVIRDADKRVKSVTVNNGSPSSVVVSFLPNADSKGNITQPEDAIITLGVNDEIINNTASMVSFTLKNEDSKSIPSVLKSRQIVLSDIELRPALSGDLVQGGAYFNPDALGAQIKIPESTNLYPRIFYGVCLAVAQNVTPGSNMTITFSGKGIGYWLEASKVNTFPGGYEQTLTNLELSQFANRYANYPALEIFRDLIRFSTDDLVSLSTFNLDTYNITSEFFQSVKMNPGTYKDVFGNDVKTLKLVGDKFEEVSLSEKLTTDAGEIGKVTDGRTLKFDGLTIPQKRNDLESKREDVFKGFPLGAPESTRKGRSTFALTNDSEWTRLGNQYSNEKALIEQYTQKNSELQRNLRSAKAANDTSQEERIQKDISDNNKKRATSNNNIKGIKEELQKIPVVQKNLLDVDSSEEILNRESTIVFQNSRKEYLESFDIISHWKGIFSKIILEVMDKDNFLNLVYPFKWDIRAPGASMDGEYISKASLADQIKEKIFFEFYLDTNGHFVLKPPLYSLDAVKINNDTYIIEDEDVTSFNLNDTAEGITTRVGVVGDYKEAQGLEKTMIYSIFQDMRLIRDFGFHAQEFSELLFIHNNAEARDFAQAMLTKLNMNLVNGSVTILGRPEIRCGMSVYLKPRDTIYYIKEVNHAFTAGASYETTLTLIGGRRIAVGRRATKQIVTVTKNTVDQAKENQQIVKVGNSKPITYYERLDDNIEFLQNEQYRIHENRSGTTRKLVASIKEKQNKINGIKRGDQDASGDDPDAELATTLASRDAEINELRLLLPNKVRDENPDRVADQLMSASLDLGEFEQVVILRNKFIITSHFNPYYIGLIVDDEQGGLFGEINASSFDFLYNLGPSSLPANAISDLKMDDNDKQNYTDFIRDNFREYAKGRGVRNGQVRDITPENAREFFTVNLREGFQLTFLSELAKKTQGLDSTIINNQDLRDEKLNDAAKVFNYITTDINTFQGFYVQYTDDQGREFPAYLDYGKSLMVENNQFKIDAALEAQKAGDEGVELEAKIRTNAKNASRVAPDFEKLVKLAQERYKIDHKKELPENNGKTHTDEAKRDKKNLGGSVPGANNGIKNPRTLWELS